VNHLTDEQLAARLDETLTGRALEEADRHLATCAQCRDALAALTEQDEALASALSHDPGEAYFATFPARVEDRLRAEGLRGAQKRMRDEGWMGWWTAPRHLAWTAAVASVIAGAGIVLLTTRDERLPAAGDRAIEKRLDQQEERATPRANSNGPSFRAQLAQPSPGSAMKDQTANARLEKQAAPMHAVPSGPLDAVTPAGPSGQAAPARMREVGQRPSLIVPSGPGASPIPVPGGGVRVGKQNVAQPMTSAPAPAAPEAGVMRAEPVPEAATRQQKTVDEARTTTGAPPMTQGFAAQGARDAQDVALCGHVLDGEGHAVARAVVTVVRLGRTAHSSDQGEFCIDAPPGSYELSVLAVGFEPARMQVRVGGERSDVQVTLNAISVLDGKAAAPAMKLSGGAAPANEEKAAADPFAGEATEVVTRVRSAQAATATATKSPSAASWQRAAADWNGVVAVAKTPAALGEAHYRAAQALVETYRRSRASATLHQQAIQACSSVLSGTPTAQQRADATRWLNELRAGH